MQNAHIIRVVATMSTSEARDYVGDDQTFDLLVRSYGLHPLPGKKPTERKARWLVEAINEALRDFNANYRD